MYHSALFVVVVAVYCSLTQGYLKVSLLNRFTYGADGDRANFKCYISETNLQGITVASRRVVNTMNTETSFNQAPDRPVQTSSNSRVYRVRLQRYNNGSFGVFACDVTRSRGGRKETTSLQTILLRGDAYIVPEDGKLTKTVNIAESDVRIEMREITGSNHERERFPNWRKDNSTVYKDKYDFNLSVPVYLSGGVRMADAGVYECQHKHRRGYAVQGLQRLIVRACPPGRWNPPNCSDACGICYNGGVCEENTGECICPAGFMGADCLTACPSARFGFNCEYDCSDGSTGRSDCGGAMICLPDPFGCRCATGYKGLGCGISCPPHYFGANCEQRCNCRTDCDNFTGACSDRCRSGFTGGSCQKCEDGLFGEDCDQECHCSEPCHQITGACPGLCSISWTKWRHSPRCDTGIANITYTKVNPRSPVEVKCTLSSPIYIEQITAELRKVSSGGRINIQSSEGLKNVTGTSAIVSITSSSIDEGDEIACILAAGSDSYAAVSRSTTISYHELPTLSYPPHREAVTNTTIAVSWIAWNETTGGDPPLVGYRAYLRKPSGGKAKYHDVANTTTQYSFQDLEADMDYTISVSAIREGENGIGPESPSISVRTNCSNPLHAPIIIAVTEVTRGGVRVTWEKPENEMIGCLTGIKKFMIYYKMLDSADEWPHSYPVTNGSAKSASIGERLDAGESYIFQMTFITAGGESPPSEKLNLTIEATTQAPVQESTKAPVNSKEETGSEENTGSGSGSLIWILILLVIVVLLAVGGVLMILRRKRNADSKYPPGTPRANVQRRDPVYDNTDAGTGDGAHVDIIDRHDGHRASVALLALPKRPTDQEQDGGGGAMPAAEESVYGNLERPDPVKVTNLPDYVAKMARNKTDGLAHQFMILPKDEQYPCTVGKKEENKKKNRFRNMLPYDHTRVVLEPLPDVPHSDYFNACYMKDHNGKVAFIASQGPNKASINDFWRMVWMTDVSIIVMVTNLIEGGKDKCTQYWPEKEDGVKQWGNISVAWTRTQQFATHVIRELTVSQSTVRRRVCQYHFVSWPDMGVPAEPTALITLVRQVKRQNQGKTAPIVVHCSAGIGRTGTFIALYCLTDVLSREKYINIFGFIEKMREDRVNMVQTVVQYQFLHDALVEVHLTSHTEIPTGLLVGFNIQSRKQLLQEEYKILNDLSKNLKQKSTAGQEPDNVLKNRFPEIIPPDRNRAFLSTGGGFKENDYINATIINSYAKRDAFITTQSPLPHTIEGYWRLVCDWKVPVIVMLNQLDGSKMCPRYWPEEGSLEYGSITVTIMAQENRGSFVCRQFEVTVQGRQAWYVEHFQLMSWRDPKGCPSGLPELLQSAYSMLAQHPKKPGIIQCMDGVGCSGSVAVVLSEIDRIRAEDRVDIFQSARQLRTSNGHFLQEEHQYMLCYKILQEYLGLNTEYGNI